MHVSTQLHSLGKVSQPATATVDAHDVDDIEILVGNQPGQLLAAFECRRYRTCFGKIEEIALKDGVRGRRIRDQHFRCVAAGERIEDNRRAAKIERARHRHLFDRRVGQARKLPA